jgi:hypothetical protein
MGIITAKKLLREEIWNKLQSNHAVVLHYYSFGHILNFVGSEKVAV